ncbi:hypothetical protein JCM9152_2174 [Halalkalibacter hemicellulosilyticusJCM 9152]|uniref:Uncharacterized protein n=2 Tax=Halalkalibacter TaxID=2893056 RepID=W4QGH2_9BACI|nr:hypothetical protein JCM9152_2174 [Halalkalibacter hemicellulosilyticusJCM 9152]
MKVKSKRKSMSSNFFGPFKQCLNRFLCNNLNLSEAVANQMKATEKVDLYFFSGLKSPAIIKGESLENSY